MRTFTTPGHQHSVVVGTVVVTAVIVIVVITVTVLSVSIVMVVGVFAVGVLIDLHRDDTIFEFRLEFDLRVT